MNIIIIGNGKSVLDYKYGQFIDNADVVIRMNSFRLDGYEENIGTKTDIVAITQTGYGAELTARMPGKLHGGLDIISNLNIFFTRPEKYGIKKELIERFRWRKKQLEFVEEETFNEIKDKLQELSGRNKVFPSAGLVTIYNAVKKYKNDNIYIYGFDSCDKTIFSHYYSKDVNIARSTHASDSECIIIKKLINENKIKELHSCKI